MLMRQESNCTFKEILYLPDIIAQYAIWNVHATALFWEEVQSSLEMHLLSFRWLTKNTFHNFYFKCLFWSSKHSFCPFPTVYGFREMRPLMYVSQPVFVWMRGANGGNGESAVNHKIVCFVPDTEKTRSDTDSFHRISSADLAPFWSPRCHYCRNVFSMVPCVGTYVMLMTFLLCFAPSKFLSLALLLYFPFRCFILVFTTHFPLTSLRK